MFFKFLLLIPIIILLSLLQGSFLSHLVFWGTTFDSLFILILLLSFFEGKHDYSGAALAVFAGFFIDIYSNNVFSFSAIAFFAVYFFVKQAKNILADLSGKYPISYFVPILIFCFILYQLILRILIVFQGRYLFSYFISLPFLFSILYNLLVGLIGFWVLRAVKTK